MQTTQRLLRGLSFLLITMWPLFTSNVTQAVEPPTKLKVLIVDGQNNHEAWPKTTLMMKQYLEESEMFEVDIARTKFTWKGKREKKYLPMADVGETEDLKKPKADPDFAPKFSDYDVVISNFGNSAAPWPEETQKSFVEFIKGGGGFVSVHAADNSFGDWPEYNEMIGIGGWGGRKGSTGTYVYYNEDKLVRDDKDGKVGGHGRQINIPITIRADHPITDGLPAGWLSAKDECYAMLRGPAENMTVLATGKDTSNKAPTNRHEPIMMVLEYGEGRIFHTTLGHETYSCEGVGFITTLLRGTQWAATGEVTIAVPEDFPSVDKPSSRAFEMKEAVTQ